MLKNLDYYGDERDLKKGFYNRGGMIFKKLF